MFRTLPLLITLSFVSTVACRRHRATLRSPTAVRWYVRPADGTAVRVGTGLALRGAVRIDASANPIAAGPPYPATAIVATARISAQEWRFAASDGSVYRAPSFTGVLTRIGALPFRVEPITLTPSGASRAVQSEGTLVVVDRTLHAHVVEGDGTHRPLALDGVITACARSRDELVVVTEPGLLHVSNDGGRSFRTERVPAGIALAAWNVDGETVLRSTAGAFRWQNGVLAPMADGPSLTTWLQVPEGLADQAMTAFATAPFSVVPYRAAEGARGEIVTAEGPTLVTRNAITGHERSREEAPGDECAVFAVPGGMRALCRHQAWAHVLFARAHGTSRWSIVRDETRAEPMGAVFFDDRSAAWAVHAPCTQRTEADPQRACLYDANGTKHELRLAVGAEIAAVHRGEALALRIGGGWRTAKAYVLSPNAARELDLPERVHRVTAVRWRDDGLHLIATGEHDARGIEPLMVVTGTRVGDAWRWRVVDAPAGHLRGVFAHDGNVISYGAHAGLVGIWHGGARFAALPSPVSGTGEALALDLDAPASCAGAWCSLGGVLTLSRYGHGAPVVARSNALPRDVEAPTAQQEVVCEHGAAVPAPEIDRGVAVTGHAMRVAVTGTTLTALWFGETLRAAATVTLPVAPRIDATTIARGVPNARVAAGLVEYCNREGCDHLLVRTGGVTHLALGRAAPGAVEVHERPTGGWLVRADDVREGVSLVTLVAVDAQGSVSARRTFALAQGVVDAAAGWWHDRDGLYVRDRGTTMRFFALDDGTSLHEHVPAPGETTAPCGVSDETAPGEARLIHRVAQVRGSGWYVEFGEWQVEERIELTRDRVCVRLISGSEPREEPAGAREERESVRSFVLRATGDGFEGRAWAGERALPLRCTQMAPRHR